VSLQGSFEVLSLAELLRSLAGARKTGVLSLDLGGGLGSIELRDGECTDARFEDRVDARDSAAGVRDCLIDLCFATLDEPRATFRFMALDVDGAAVGVDVDSLLPDVERLAAEWEGVRQRIPSLAAVPMLSTQLGGNSITLTGSQWAVLASCDGRRSVREIAPFGCRATIATCRTLLELIEQTAITLTEPLLGQRDQAMLVATTGRDVQRVETIDMPQLPVAADDDDAQPSSSPTGDCSSSSIVSTPFGDVIDEPRSSGDTTDRLATMQVFASLLDAQTGVAFAPTDDRVAMCVTPRR
jgi:hypothetical protein